MSNSEQPMARKSYDEICADKDHLGQENRKLRRENAGLCARAEKAEGELAEMTTLLIEQGNQFATDRDDLRLKFEAARRRDVTVRRPTDEVQTALSFQAERDTARAQLAEARGEVEQLHVQQAGVSVAALGGTVNVASQVDYGWSVAYQDVLELRRKYDELQAENERLSGMMAAATDLLRRWQTLPPEPALRDPARDWESWNEQHKAICEEASTLLTNTAATATATAHDARVRAEAEKFTVAAFVARQIEWSRKTFGEGMRTLGVTRHIEKELEEIRADPTDLKEWIDVVMLALDGAWRTGASPEQIQAELERKYQVVRSRTYPMPTNQDDPVEHIRDKAGSSNA